MTLEEQKFAEEKLAKLLGDLTSAEKAVLYKTLHAEGLRITACDALIRRAPAPASLGRQNAAPTWAALPRGMPPLKVP